LLLKAAAKIFDIIAGETVATIRRVHDSTLA
jgi:hypothetical protein